MTNSYIFFKIWQSPGTKFAVSPPILPFKSPEGGLSMTAVLSAVERLQFEDHVREFESGHRSAEAFRAERIAMGIYEQRVRGRYLMRFRIPAGRITARQVMAIAGAADVYGDGAIHLTTRQEVQIHNLSIDQLVPVVRRLLPFGLISKGCAGNSIRNIISCPACDLFGAAVFDVAPFARRLSQKLLTDPESFRLPRGLKISVSACPGDCAESAFADIGFMARRVTDNPLADQIGFQVMSGGGLGSHCSKAVEIESFVPPDEMYLVVAAIRKIWMDRGQFGEKHYARLRFLIHDMGEDAFRRLYFFEKEKLREWMPWPIFPLEEGRVPPNDPSPIPSSLDLSFIAWKKTSVAAQKDGGYYAVGIPSVLGDMPAADAGILAESLWNQGLNDLRITTDQNLIVSDVPGHSVPQLYDTVMRLHMTRPLPVPLGSLAVCPGAGTCQVGVIRAKDAADEILKLSGRAYWEHPALQHLTIRVGGCYNNCVRPTAAILGFSGVARSSADRDFPAYQVLWGGRVSGVDSEMAEVRGIVPARWLAVFVDTFLDKLASILPREANIERLIMVGRHVLDVCLPEFQETPNFKEAPAFYHDWGSDEAPFTTEGSGGDECAAG